MPREILVHLNVAAEDRDGRNADEIGAYVVDAYDVGAESHEGGETLTVTLALADEIGACTHSTASDVLTRRAAARAAVMGESVPTEITQERLPDGSRIVCTWTLPRFAGQDPWLVEGIPNTVGDLCADLEQVANVSAASVEQMGGDCLAVVVHFADPGRVMILTRAFQQHPGDPWETEPSLAKTAAGPWHAGIYLRTTYEDGGAAVEELAPVDAAGALALAEKWAVMPLLRPVERKNGIRLHQAETVPCILDDADLDTLGEQAVGEACGQIAQMLKDSFGITVTGDFGPDETQTLDEIGRALTLAMLANRVQS